MALSEQRRKLGERIAKLRAIQRERDQLAAAGSPAQEDVWNAQTAVENARAAVEKAARAAVDHRIAILAGSGDDAPPSVEDTRQKVRHCEDALAAARAARDEIEIRSRSVEEKITYAQRDVVAAAQGVTWSESQDHIRRIIADVRAAQRAYAEKVGLALFMHAQAPWPYPEKDPDAAELRAIVRETGTPPVTWRNATGGPDAAAKWKTALAALQTDANAKLPR